MERPCIHDPQLALITNCDALLGEGPVWVERDAALYWVDIKVPRIWKWHCRDDESSSWEPPFRVTSLAPRRSGGFVAGTEHGFALIDPEKDFYELIGDPEQHCSGNRFNDGKLDGYGNFWAGTMDDAEQEPLGALYRLDPQHRWTCQDTGYFVPNGPAFSPDGQRLYHADSARGLVYRFHLTDEGQVAEREVWLQFEPSQGSPDGMTTDADGNLWIAFWDGWALRCFTPEGFCLATLDVPVQRPTSCAFGGPALDRLFITSARIGLSEAQLEVQPLAGALFSARPTTGGTPIVPFPG